MLNYLFTHKIFNKINTYLTKKIENIQIEKIYKYTALSLTIALAGTYFYSKYKHRDQDIIDYTPYSYNPYTRSFLIGAAAIV